MNHAPDFAFAIFMLLSLGLGIILGWHERGARAKRRVRLFLRNVRDWRRGHARQRQQWLEQKKDIESRAVEGAIQSFDMGMDAGLRTSHMQGTSVALLRFYRRTARN